MAKGAKELIVYVIKTCSSFGNIKMDAKEGVRSFNFEVGQKFKSFKEFESQFKHYQDAHSQYVDFGVVLRPTHLRWFHSKHPSQTMDA
jgi:hypothetical protein